MTENKKALLEVNFALEKPFSESHKNRLLKMRKDIKRKIRKERGLIDLSKIKEAIKHNPFTN